MFWLPQNSTPAVAIEAPVSTPDFAPFVDEAAQKTGIPLTIIWAVIDMESARKPHAISSQGGMGLMQLMPDTWDKMRRRLSLGTDPFDPHDNILAGSYYLRALYDAYGPDGFLAAYNAGPSRWESHRNTGQPLPPETRTYVAAIAQKLGATVLDFAPMPSQAKPTPWTEASLFLPGESDPSPADKPFSPAASPFVSMPSPPASTAQ